MVLPKNIKQLAINKPAITLLLQVLEQFSMEIKEGKYFTLEEAKVRIKQFKTTAPPILINPVADVLRRASIG